MYIIYVVIVPHEVLELAAAILISQASVCREGGIPNNMVMNNNQVIDTPYSLNIENAAISVYVDEVAATRNTQIPALGTPMHNVTIQGNTVVSAILAGWHCPELSL